MRPIFTIHAGEYLVANYIEQHYGKAQGVRVGVPSKDDGIDLLVTSKDCKRAVTLQDKFSKSYINVGDYKSSLGYLLTFYWIDLLRHMATVQSMICILHEKIRR